MTGKNIPTPQEQIAEKIRREKERALHVFSIPAKLAEKIGVNNIGLVELTGEEELMVTSRARNDVARLAYELARESLRMINDKPVSTADGSADKAWNTMHPQVRGMVVQAYSDVHNADSTDVQAFLESRVTTCWIVTGKPAYR